MPKVRTENNRVIQWGRSSLRKFLLPPRKSLSGSGIFAGRIFAGIFAGQTEQSPFKSDHSVRRQDLCKTSGFLSPFTGVPCFLAVVALIACWLPAHRAAAVEPQTVLRHE
jgi:ABC-type lipoprotein release transport system permease subunit